MGSKLKAAAMDSVGELPAGYLHLPTTPIKQEQKINWNEDVIKTKLLNAVSAMSFQTGESVEEIVKFLTDDGGLTKLMLAYFCDGGKK